VARIRPNLKVMQWLPLAERWAGQGVVPVPVALVLAIIQMESAGIRLQEGLSGISCECDP
jgi:soluble lytic murein transglycosylase-like protein